MLTACVRVRQTDIRHTTERTDTRCFWIGRLTKKKKKLTVHQDIEPQQLAV